MTTHTLPVSERLERHMLEALHAAADADTRERLGLRLEAIGGALVSIAAHDPSILLNRTIGLGLAEPATAEMLETIRARYAEAGIERFFLHVHPESKPDDIADVVAEAGFQRHRRWMKFERGTEPPPEAASDLAVREIGPDHVDAFGRIVAAAFDLTPGAAPLFGGLVGQPGMHLYMSFDDDTPAGTGLLYIDGPEGWFDCGATDPAFRGRGAQRAVLAHRAQAAIDAGCTRLHTCTGEAVPGDPQHSYHNIEWVGFRPSCLRENWVPG